jgi:putative PIN family toxin of toxin-antitoxin system
MTTKSVKVIIDTNIWISFLIGRRLAKIKRHITNGSITIIITEQLLSEIRTVTNRDKFKKYFPRESVREFIELLETIGEKLRSNRLISFAETQKTIFF